MAHPAWALKFKTKDTSVRCVRAKYYIYKASSKRDRDPITKKSKTITLKQIGVLTEDYGLIPTGIKRRGRIPKREFCFKAPPEAEKKETNFMDELSQINDERSEKNQLHTASEILFLASCSALCGGDGWQDMEDFDELRLDFLRDYFTSKNGAASNDTCRRFFRTCDLGTFEKCFRDWVGTLAKIDQPQVIAIDGKSSRHSFDDSKKMLHMVNVLATESLIVMGQEKVDEKSNEITATPKILEWLDVKGHIVTIDAMGFQYAIADKILEKGRNYIFSLKGNQGNLSDDVTVYFGKEMLTSTTFLIDHDKGYGRLETRKCFVSHDVQWLKERNKNWQSIQSIICIESTRNIKNNVTIENRYYISSLKETPKKMLESIRSYWGIQNSLHWVLDMSFFDDQSRIRKGNAPQIMAILRHIAFNLLQLVKTEKLSIKRLRKMCALSPNLLEETIARKIS